MIGVRDGRVCLLHKANQAGDQRGTERDLGVHPQATSSSFDEGEFIVATSFLHLAVLHFHFDSLLSSGICRAASAASIRVSAFPSVDLAEPIVDQHDTKP